MRKYLYTTIVLMVSLLLGWKVQAQISIHDLLGKWVMQKVYRGGAEVSHQYIPDAKRWIEFRSDFTFVSDGEPYGRKQGYFTLDEDTGLLSFDLDLGFGVESYWQVEFDGQKMIWTDRGNPMIDQIKIILVPDY
jgi:hypothetical protein